MRNINNFNLEVFSSGLTKFQAAFLTFNSQEAEVMIRNGADISMLLPPDLNRRSCFFLMNEAMFRDTSPEKIPEKFEIFKLLFTSYSLSHIRENRDLNILFEEDLEQPKDYFRKVGYELDEKFLKELKFKQRVYFADEEFEKFKVESGDLSQEELLKASEIRAKIQTILRDKDPHEEHLRFHNERIRHQGFLDNYFPINTRDLGKIFLYQDHFLDPENFTFKLDQVRFGENDNEFKRLLREYYLKLNSYNLLALKNPEIIPSTPIKFPDGFQKNIFNVMVFLHDAENLKDFPHSIYTINQDDGNSSNIFDLLLSGVENYRNAPGEKVAIVCQLLINGAMPSHKKTAQQTQEIADKLIEFSGKSIPGVDNEKFIREYLQKLEKFKDELESFPQLEIGSEASKEILQIIKEKTINCVDVSTNEALSPRGLLTYFEYFGIHDFLYRHKDLEGYKEVYESINKLIDLIPNPLPIHEKKDKMDEEIEAQRKAREEAEKRVLLKEAEEQAKKIADELLKSEMSKKLKQESRAKRQGEEKARQIANQEAKAKREAEEKARQEAKAKKEAEEKARQIAKQEAKEKKRVEEKAQQEAKAKRQAEESQKHSESKALSAPLATPPPIFSPPISNLLSKDAENLMIIGEFHEALRESNREKIVDVAENHQSLAGQLFFREYGDQSIIYEIIKSSNCEFLKTFLDCANSLSREKTLKNLLKSNIDGQNIFHFFSDNLFQDDQKVQKLDCIKSEISEDYWSIVINLRDREALTPLDRALRNHDVNFALALTERGAQLSACRDHSFSYILQICDVEVVKKFIDFVRQNDEIFVIYGVNQFSENVIHNLSTNMFINFEQKVEKLELISSAISEEILQNMLNQKDAQGFVPLDYAIGNGDVNFALTLIQKGAKFSACKTSIIDQVVNFCDENYLREFINFSKQNGEEYVFQTMDINSQNSAHYLAYNQNLNGDQKIKKLNLITAEINDEQRFSMINQIDVQGLVPLDYAIANGDINFALELAKKGANLHLNNIQETVLVKFFKNGNFEMMKSFYEEGLIKFTEISEDALQNFKLLCASNTSPFLTQENPLAKEFLNFINEKKVEEDQKKIEETKKETTEKTRNRRGKWRNAEGFQAVRGGANFRENCSEIEGILPLPTPRNPTLLSSQQQNQK